MTAQSSLFDVPAFDPPSPDIRTTPPSAPGSESSRLAAEAIDGPFRKKSWRKVLLVLIEAGHPLSREEIAERTRYKECGLCARIDELRPLWVQVVEGACVSSSGVAVDGYVPTQATIDRHNRRYL